MKREYADCAEQVMALLSHEHGTTHTLMQLAIISFQRIGYVAGIEAFASLALDITARDLWHRILLELTLGRKSLPEVLSVADSPRQRCQAHFYAGTKFATEGQTSHSREQFTRAAQWDSSCVERELAGHELARGRTKPTVG